MTIQSAAEANTQGPDANHWQPMALTTAFTLASTIAIGALKALQTYAKPPNSTETSNMDMRSATATATASKAKTIPRTHVNSDPKLKKTEEPKQILDPFELFGAIAKNPDYALYFDAQTEKQITLPPLAVDQHNQLFKPLINSGKTFKAFELLDMLTEEQKPIGYAVLSHCSDSDSSQIGLPINAVTWLTQEVLPTYIDAKSNSKSVGPWLQHFGDEFFFVFERNDYLHIAQNRPTYDGRPLVRLSFSHPESAHAPQKLRTLFLDAPTEVERLKTCLAHFCEEHSATIDALTTNLQDMQQNIEPSVIDRCKRQFNSELINETLMEASYQPEFAPYATAQNDKQVKLPPIAFDFRNQPITPLKHEGKTFEAFKLFEMLTDYEPTGYVVLVHPERAQYSQLALPINAIDWLEHEVITEFIDTKSSQQTAGPWLKNFGDEFYFIYDHDSLLHIFQNRPSYDGFPLVRMTFSHPDSQPAHVSHSNDPDKDDNRFIPPPLPTEVERLHWCLERLGANDGDTIARLSPHMDRLQEKIEPTVLEQLEQRFKDALNKVAQRGAPDLGKALKQWETNQTLVNPSPPVKSLHEELLEDMASLPRTPNSVMTFPSAGY